MACETFCLDTDESFSSATLHNDTLTIDTVRLVPVNETIPLDVQLGKYHNKNVSVGRAKEKPRNLHRSASAQRSTILVEIVANNVHYEPGDHVGIFPANRKEIVDGILDRLSGVDNVDEILQLQFLKENHTTNGTGNETFPKTCLWLILLSFISNRCVEELGTTRKITGLFIANAFNAIFGLNDTSNASAINTFGHIL